MRRILPTIGPLGGNGGNGLDWIDLRLADGADPVDPNGMLRVPITETDGLFEVDFLNDSGGTVSFRDTGDVVRIDFGALSEEFPTGPGVGIAVQFYDVQFVSRNFAQPTVTLGFAEEPPESGNFNCVGPGFRLSSASSASVDDPRVWPVALAGINPSPQASPSAENAMQAQGGAYAALPTGRGCAWSANDTVLADAIAGTFARTRSRLLLLIGAQTDLFNTEGAKFRFRCRYAPVPPEDFPA